MSDNGWIADGVAAVKPSCGALADVMFGPVEPPDPTLILARIRRRAKGTLQQQLVGLDAGLAEVAEATLGPLASLRLKLYEARENMVQGLEALPNESEPLRVVLIGRTMAGKSTLFQYLTGSDASAIGVGGQRTTRKCISALYRFAENVLIVDTPGVGAKDGAKDQRIALEEARRADVLLWMANNNSLQAETRQALSLVASWGTPLIVALNCFEDIKDEQARAWFLKDPERTFVDLQGHIDTFQRTLDTYGQQPLHLLPIHAEAAQLSAGSGPDSERFRKASGIEALEGALRTEASAMAPQRRAVASSDIARKVLKETSAFADRAASELRLLIGATVSAREDFQRRAERIVGDASLKHHADTAARLRRLDDWADSHYAQDDKALSEAWQETADQVIEDLDVLLQESLRQLANRLDKVQKDVWAGWERTLHASATTSRVRTKVNVNPIWLEPSIRAGGSTLGGAIGFALGGIPGAILGGFLGELLGRGIASIFSSRKSQLRRRRESLHKSVREARDAYQASVDDAWDRSMQDLAKMLRKSERSGDRQRQSIEAHQRALAELSVATAETSDRLDTALMRDLLELEGRRSLADAVAVAFREPGVVTAIGLRDELALSEAYLRPPSLLGDVRYYPHIAGVSASRKASHALALGRSMRGHLSSAQGSLEVSLRPTTSERVLDIEQALASQISGMPIHVTSRK